jgi:hypothetical protein
MLHGSVVRRFVCIALLSSVVVQMVSMVRGLISVCVCVFLLQDGSSGSKAEEVGEQQSLVGQGTLEASAA